MKTQIQHYRLATGVALLGLLLTACGGGSGGSAASGGGSSSGSTVSGVAATGAAISGGAVSAVCVSGTAAGTTGSDGSFSLNLDSGQTPPCMLKVSKGGLTLYSYAAAAGHVNITPLTDMVLARALADSPAVAFNTFSVANRAAISSGLAAAETYVQAQVSGAGLGTPGIDPLTGSFVVGDANDSILDALGTALTAAGKSIDDLRFTAAGGTVLTSLIPAANPAAGELTIPATLSALAVGMNDITDAATLNGLAGTHTFGRGIRGEHNHSTATPPAPAIVGGCTLSVSGGNLVLSAAAQQVSVSLTPSHITVTPSFLIQNITAQVLAPADLTSRIILRVGTTAGDSVNLTIVDGYVSEANSVDNTANVYTECGSNTGANLNTDRSGDVLTLPAGFISSLVESASPPATYTHAVTASDLVGVAATIHFGRGIYRSYNNDANHTVKTETAVSDCEFSLANGSLHLSSASAGFDHSFPVYTLGYSGGTSANVAMLGQDSTVATLQGQFRMDYRTGTPIVSMANGGDYSAGILTCPLL
jgi:hypothetical protein